MGAIKIDFNELEICTDENSADVLVSGVLDDHLAIDLIPSENIRVNLKELIGITRKGIDSWLRWAESISPDTEVHLEHCPPCFILQANQVQNFLPKNFKVDSFYIPYREEGESKSLLLKNGEDYTLGKKAPDWSSYHHDFIVTPNNYTLFLPEIEMQRFALFDHMLDSIIVLDDERRIVYCNEAASKAIGLSPRRIIKKRPLCKDIISFSDESLFCMGGEVGKDAFGQYFELDYESCKGEQGHTQLFIVPGPLAFSGRKYWTLYMHDVSLERQLESKYKNESELALTDDMTGLKNFRGLQIYLEQELHRIKRYDFDLGLIMIDVDHFKKFNDTYGHQQGDLVLKKVAEALQKFGRKSDFMARYGGEEFMAILPQTDAEGVRIAAEKLRKAIEETKVENLQNPSETLSVTASFGATCIHGGKLEVSQLESSKPFIEQADQNLYKAKDGGRNQVVFSDYPDVEKLQEDKN